MRGQLTAYLSIPKEERLTKRFPNVEFTDDLRKQIDAHAAYSDLVVIGPDLAIVIDNRSGSGSTGGVAYYDQVRVFYGAQTEMQEWQWRDRYDTSRDRHDLQVHGLGEIEVIRETDKVIVKVELVNRDHGKRTAVYTFKPAGTVVVQTLSAEEQREFFDLLTQEIGNALKRPRELWPHKPHMHDSNGRLTSYHQPNIKQVVERLEIGVAAFVVEEQIDHFVDDRQMQYTLFVLTRKSGKAEQKAEDHGYNNREGGAFLTIIEVEVDHIVINTKQGKETISLL